MTCPECGERVRITHTFSAGDGAQTRTAICEGCDLSMTLLQIVVCFEKVKQKRHTGAYALAKKVRARGVPPIDLD